MKRSLFGSLFMHHRGRLSLSILALLLPVVAFAKGSIITSPHNFSAGAAAQGGLGKSGIAFSEEERICIFCHTPHNAVAQTPLWSRELPAAEYIPYVSSTQREKPGPDWSPTGASRLCLSCHDGTVAIGKFAGSPIKTARFVTGRANIGRGSQGPNDLSDDHPISFSYLNAFAGSGELAPLGSLPATIHFEWQEYMQCTSCHDPHNNEFGNFLVMNNGDPTKPEFRPGSQLCVTCHKNSGWDFSTHNPALTSSMTNGCLTCHAVHAAPGPERLLTAAKESDTCYLSCHNDPASPTSNVKPLFDQPYRHPVGTIFTPPHDEGKEKNELPAVNYHVECVDCHNPHQANAMNVPVSLLSPPAITGRMKGVTGIDRFSRGIIVATAEYEVCFKCHSGPKANEFLSDNKPNRMFGNPDQISRFDKQNTTSFHPVTDRIPGWTGASLLTAAMRTSMQMIYCSDCHNSDRSANAKIGGTGPNGPHGSQYEHILMARYDMPVPTSNTPPYSTGSFPSSYDLCFRCHSDTYITGALSGFRNGGTNLHDTHVVGSNRLIPCFACHDPHGVPGAPTVISSHLVNFDRAWAADVVTVPNPVYLPAITGGSCTVKCHTSANHTRTYVR